MVLLVFLGLTGSALVSAFRASAEKSQAERLRIHIYGLLAVAERSPRGLDLPAELPEPGFNQLGSGLYALIFDLAGREVWRSPSALDLSLPPARLAELASGIDTGQSRFGTTAEAGGRPLYYYNYGIRWQGDGEGSAGFVFATLELTDPLEREIDSFGRRLWIWLGGAVGVLVVLQGLIMAWGLAPLRRVAEDLAAIENGRQEQLEGSYPAEIEGVTRNLNLLLASERAQRERHKALLADLAHSLKTPLAILKGLASAGGARAGGEPAPAESLAQTLAVVEEQVARMDQIVSYQLQRAVSTAPPPIRRSVPVAPVVARLVDALRKVYAERGIEFETDVEDCAFYGDERDLLELLGNLLDNACKYGRGRVGVRVHPGADEPRVYIQVEDNGPGIPGPARRQVLARGARLDSREPGQGIGLAVAADLVAAYNGRIEIADSRLGGALILVAI